MELNVPLMGSDFFGGWEMKNRFVMVVALSTLLGVATAQQVNSTPDASASSSNSVSAGKSGANVQSSTSGNASDQTSVSGPKRQNQANPKESKSPNKTNASSASALNEGSTINAALVKPVDSKNCKPGDPVVAKSTQNAKSDGSVVIPKGSKLVGHVTEAQARSEGASNSSLGIVFDHAVLKNGQEVPVHGVVQALAAGQANASSAMGDDDLQAMGSTAATGTGAVRSGGGLLGGVGSTAAAATSSVANTGNVAHATGSTVGSVAGSSRALQGTLNSSSTGVVGLHGLSLESAVANSTQGSVISSTGKSVHLDSGTQMVLRVVNQ
jgi:hypothetical protein